MPLEHEKAAIVGAWVLSSAAIVVSLNAGSPSAWQLLIGMGLLPPLVLSRIWPPPAQGMSEGYA